MALTVAAGISVVLLACPALGTPARSGRSRLRLRSRPQHSMRCGQRETWSDVSASRLRRLRDSRPDAAFSALLARRGQQAAQRAPPARQASLRSSLIAGLMPVLQSGPRPGVDQALRGSRKLGSRIASGAQCAGFTRISAWNSSSRRRDGRHRPRRASTRYAPSAARRRSSDELAHMGGRRQSSGWRCDWR